MDSSKCIRAWTNGMRSVSDIVVGHSSRKHLVLNIAWNLPSPILDMKCSITPHDLALKIKGNTYKESSNFFPVPISFV